MSELLIRTLSQGLQAFLPVAVCFAWIRRAGPRELLTSVRWGIAAAILATPVAGYLFQQSVRQARWEAALAAFAAGLTLYLGPKVWRRTPSQSETRKRGVAWRAAVIAATVLIVTRQTMEIAVVFRVAVLELRSADAVAALGWGTLAALTIACAWVWLGRRSSQSLLKSATATFAGVFLGQTLLYAVHESSEALLPWAETLHVATEPYGPDGVYGPYISGLLVALPIAVVVMTLARARFERVFSRSAAWVAERRLAALSLAGLAVLALSAVVIWQQGSVRTSALDRDESAPSGGDFSAVTAGPHLLYQQSGVDRDRNMLAVAALNPPGAAAVSVPVTCERVSFAAGRGICLQADRGVFTTYRAAMLDRDLKPGRSLKLDGAPSRTRVSRDGRVGAATVFVTGASHGYAGSEFSTKTILLDMASGDVLGDLEQFATWRDGARFQAADFNFWGVTFAKDSDVFYATLRTGGKTYLVRGDLGLRKMSVLHENVECPSLSPNDRLIAYKKRVGTSMAPWRLYVLDLATMTERAVSAEARSFDDQIEWLDDANVLYAVRRSSQSAFSDVWVAPIDGSGSPRVFLTKAESPIVVR